MLSNNLGWIYYKEAFGFIHNDYFIKLIKPDGTKSDKKDQQQYLKDHVDKHLFASIGNQMADLESLAPVAFEATHNPKLTTTYPGLLTGSGIGHEAGLEGELKLGFQFDHTTGLPYIPGSSVKGKLRSFFPYADKLGEKNEKLRKDRCELLNCILEEVGLPKLEKDKIAELELETFEGIKPGNKKEVGPEGRLSMLKRDLFLDAFPVNIIGPNQGGRTQLFGDDFITPHKHPTDHKYDAFVDPIPIRFLKVMPGVVFRFQFKLNDGVLSAENKEKLFTALLQWGGVGAKTNVGYGQLITEDQYKATLGESVMTFDEPDDIPASFEEGMEVEAEIVEMDFSDNKVSLSVKGNDGLITQQVRRLLDRRDLTIGKKVTTTVRRLTDDGQIKYLGQF